MVYRVYLTRYVLKVYPLLAMRQDKDPRCHLPINTHNSQKQPDNFDEILQAKAKLRKYLKEKCSSES